MARPTPKVFTIPSGIPFARALSDGVVRMTDRDPLQLADTLVLVPTRRAARNLHEVFAATLGGAALIPRIRALGDLDDEESLFDPSTEDMHAPPTIAPLRRLLLLATLVQRWADAKGSPLPFTQAVSHGRELAGFLDETVTQSVDLAKLDTLAPEDLAAHWHEVAEFLRIIAERWPVQLAAEGAAEPAERRNAHLRALAAALSANPPRTPVIAAGSTGSIPATAELLKIIAHLPTGAVVLPGLDTALDATSWDSLDPSHAQFGLRQLLAHIGVTRDDVETWLPLPDGHGGRAERVRFLSEALRPPPTTDAWRDLLDRDLLDTGARGFAPGLENLALIEAATPREEALVVACALREALETPGRTAALVTPDRTLARRVAAELTRWDIAIDDSAGQTLSRTPPGVFLSDLARATAERFAPVPLLALLKHPFAAGGEDRTRFLDHVRELEKPRLRGLKPEPGLPGIGARLEKTNAPEGLRRWFAKLERRLQPLADAMDAAPVMLGALARTHASVAEALAATDAAPGADVLWRKEAGEAAAQLIADLMKEGADIELRDGRLYAELFRDLAGMRAVRPPYNRHPRLAILGPLEARLLDFDLVILSGLNEGTWPGEASTDPWLSRPMRAKLGLEPPERRIGLSAHDFVTLAASRNVLMTRSLKENGAPAVASRWLLRLKQLAKGLGFEKKLDARSDLLAWTRALDSGAREKRAPRPQPRPPVAARPTDMSVTEIETWLRDPYAIYARRVLRLKPLEPIDAEPGPPERGNAVHNALEKFLKAHPDALPPDAIERLLAFGEEAFAQVGATPAVLALWRPRFRRAAHWFIRYETERRKSVARFLVEVSGVLEIPSQPVFALRGRADRIDLFADGTAAIVDYKTGRVPSDRQIEQLLSPQLPLEGAMLMKGAFADARAEGLREFVHIQLTGGEPVGKECVTKLDKGAQAKAMEALAKLTARIACYADERQPYRSRDMPFRLNDIGDYDHLARVREWTLESEEDDWIPPR